MKFSTVAILVVVAGVAYVVYRRSQKKPTTKTAPSPLGDYFSDYVAGLGVDTSEANMGDPS